LWLRIIADTLVSAAAEHSRFTQEGAVQMLMQDVAYAVRGLVRRPGFTAIVLATLALGIGANAAIFSVVSGILLRPLPYPHAEQVVDFGHAPPTWLTSDANF